MSIPHKRSAYQSPEKVFRIKFAEEYVEKKESFENWKNLPSDIVERIMQTTTLSTTDVLNMSLACKSWKPNDVFLARTLCQKRIDISRQGYSSCMGFMSHFIENVSVDSRVDVLKQVIQCGSTDILQKCQSFGYFFNSVDDKGQSILCSAIEAGRVNVLQFLIQNCNTCVNIVDHFGESPLMFAIMKGSSIEIIECLLRNGSSVFTEAYDRATPLYLAVNDNRLAVSELLLKHGSPVDAPDIDGLTPFHLAVKNQSIDMVRLLHKFGASTDRMTEYSGFTPLHQAALRGNVDILTFLLETGVDEKSKTIDGKTILHVACMGCQYDLCKWIIDRGIVDIDAKDDHEFTALYYATQLHDIDIVQLLLERGSDPFIGDVWLKISLKIGWKNLKVLNPNIFGNSFLRQLFIEN